MRKAVFAVLLTVLGFSACGSPTDSTTFTVPDGWKATVGFGPFMQIWTRRGDDSQVLMLMKLPVAMKPQDAMSSANIKNGKVDKQETITICGKQQAMFFAATSVDEKTHRRSADELVMSNVNGNMFMAIYSRPEHAPVDQAAENAIRNVCPKK